MSAQFEFIGISIPYYGLLLLRRVAVKTAHPWSQRTDSWSLVESATPIGD